MNNFPYYENCFPPCHRLASNTQNLFEGTNIVYKQSQLNCIYPSGSRVLGVSVCLSSILRHLLAPLTWIESQRSKCKQIPFNDIVADGGRDPAYFRRPQIYRRYTMIFDKIQHTCHSDNIQKWTVRQKKYSELSIVCTEHCLHSCRYIKYTHSHTNKHCVRWFNLTRGVSYS